MTPVKLSEAQRRVLERVPDELARWYPRRGMPHLIMNPTADALERRGLIEREYMPPRWRRTPAGRAALRGERDGGPSALTTPQGER